MDSTTRPFLGLYVAWHPSFSDGADIAEEIRAHYGRDVYGDISSGLNLSVQFRSAPERTGLPIHVHRDETTLTVVIALIDSAWQADRKWVEWAKELEQEMDAPGYRFCPVFITPSAEKVGVAAQAIRFDQWNGLAASLRMQRLFVGITYMLAQLMQDVAEPPAAAAPRPRIRVFLSHSKHDPDKRGLKAAKALRKRIFDGAEGLDSFLDVYDIAAATHFDREIRARVQTSAVVVFHSDTYSSRVWCQKEVLAAKQAQRPLVVAHCVGDSEHRAFPYLGNVPVVRINTASKDRIEIVLSRLLDEVLRTLLWRSRVTSLAQLHPQLAFLTYPPELASLTCDSVSAQGEEAIVVYPDPPLPTHELELIGAVAPRTRLRTLQQWTAEDVK